MVRDSGLIVQCSSSSFSWEWSDSEDQTPNADTLKVPNVKDDTSSTKKNKKMRRKRKYRRKNKDNDTTDTSTPTSQKSNGLQLPTNIPTNVSYSRRHMSKELPILTINSDSDVPEKKKKMRRRKRKYRRKQPNVEDGKHSPKAKNWPGFPLASKIPAS